MCKCDHTVKSSLGNSWNDLCCAYAVNEDTWMPTFFFSIWCNNKPCMLLSTFSKSTARPCWNTQDWKHTEEMLVESMNQPLLNLSAWLNISLLFHKLSVHSCYTSLQSGQLSSASPAERDREKSNVWQYERWNNGGWLRMFWYWPQL